MKKMIFFILLFFSIGISNVNASTSEIVIDANSGRVLYGKNINERRLIASTTKILTALVVINNASMDDIVKVGEEIKDAYGSSIYIKQGEEYTVKDLLYGLILRSGNDAALSLAVHVGGSVDGFVALMNDTALNIGMKSSTFNNPHGLDEQTENMSTVYDMAILMRKAMENDIFKEITGAKSHKFSANGQKYEWYNKNKLLSEYKYATGGKIGYTKRAGHTFVSSATKDGKNLITVSFLDQSQFSNHKRLYEKYFSIYKNYTLLDKNNLNIGYKKGFHLYTDEDFSMLLKEKELNGVKKEVVIFKEPIIENDRLVVGNIHIFLNNEEYKALKIYSNFPKKKKDFFTKLKESIGW